MDLAQRAGLERLHGKDKTEKEEMKNKNY